MNNLTVLDVLKMSPIPLTAYDLHLIMDLDIDSVESQLAMLNENDNIVNCRGLYMYDGSENNEDWTNYYDSLSLFILNSTLVKGKLKDIYKLIHTNINIVNFYFVLLQLKDRDYLTENDGFFIITKNYIFIIISSKINYNIIFSKKFISSKIF